MKKIAVMGANAARQKTLVFEQLRPGEVNRAISMSEIPSGKGINFCRAVRNWNRADAVVVQFAGGDNGRYLVDALSKETLNAVTIPSRAPLRCCMTCIDRTNHTTTELIEPSGAADAAECDAFAAAFSEELAHCDGAAICGTLPGNTDPALYLRIAEMVASQKKPLLLDAFKNVEKLLSLPGIILKINREELTAFTGCPQVSTGIKYCFQHYPALRAVAITDGPAAAWASDGNTLFKFEIPPLPEVVNPIGCGDTASAVLLSELLNGTTLAEAFKSALGAASSNAESVIPAQFDAARGAELAGKIKVTSEAL